MRDFVVQQESTLETESIQVLLQSNYPLYKMCIEHYPLRWERQETR